MKKLTYDEFLKIFKNKFINAKFEIISHLENHYVLTKTKYGLCKSSMYHLLNGKSPSIRSALNKKDYFINNAKDIHGDKYDYTFTKFEISTKNIQYICNKHGIVEQKPGCHLKGNGCNKCKYDIISKKNSENESGGYSLKNWENKAKKSKKFDFFKCYIINIQNENENFYKIGRTFTTIQERFRKIKYNYKIIKIFKGNAEEMYKLEVKLKRLNKENKYIPNIKFAGSKECFYKIKLENEEYI